MNSKTTIQTLIALAIAFAISTHAMGDAITIRANVDKTVVAVGDDVSWSIEITVSDTASNNFGIATVSANLIDSFGDELSAGIVGDEFRDYGFTSGGDFDPTSRQLLEISAALFQQDSSKAEAIDSRIKPDTNLGPLLLARGTYVATTVGAHMLSPSAGATNNFFTAENQTTGNGTVDFDVFLETASFNVVAVPEPGTAGLGLIGLVCLALRRHRSKVH